jgi:hypothetical protein
MIARRAVLALLVVLAAAGCTPRPDPAPRPDPVVTSAATVTVTYLITGTATMADVTYADGEGGIGQQSDVDVPLSPGLAFTVPPRTFVSISGQAKDDVSVTITCAIEVDGVTVQTVTSTGLYVIASCSGTA